MSIILIIRSLVIIVMLYNYYRVNALNILKSIEKINVINMLVKRENQSISNKIKNKVFII